MERTTLRFKDYTNVRSFREAHKAEQIEVETRVIGEMEFESENESLLVGNIDGRWYETFEIEVVPGESEDELNFRDIETNELMAIDINSIKTIKIVGLEIHIETADKTYKAKDWVSL